MQIVCIIGIGYGSNALKYQIRSGIEGYKMITVSKFPHDLEFSHFPWHRLPFPIFLVLGVLV